MPEPALDLDAYFARIGYTGTREPSLATLRALHLHHVLAVPFENLDVLLGRTISLELGDLARKIVHERRGGYCYEQNTLFAAVLRALGFHVATLVARVRWQVPAEQPTARTHMILRVEADGRPWLADVGFGSAGLTGPIALDAGEIEQTTPHEARRLAVRGEYTVHQVRIGGEWHDAFQFTSDAVPSIDYEVANWFSNKHPRSHFQQNLIVTRARADGSRVLLFNRELTERRRDGSAVKRPVHDADELLALLAAHFDLHFSAGTRFGPPGSAWPS